MEEKLLNIREAAEFLGVSVDTLRRWDKSGKLAAVRKNGGTHRYYREDDLLVLTSNLVKLANDWFTEDIELPSQFYCANRAVFEARLIKMQDDLARANIAESLFPLVVAITGEIGNNSFDHNIGRWPDIPGVFFGYDIVKRKIALADKGLGILATLSRVRPELITDEEALRVAFSEIVSGRAPEARGNGLKFVREVIAGNSMSLFFKTGDAELRLKKNVRELDIKKSNVSIGGCLAIIEF